MVLKRKANRVRCPFEVTKLIPLISFFEGTD